MTEPASHAIGIDVGGTKIAGGLVDLGHRICPFAAASADLAAAGRSRCCPGCAGPSRRAGGRSPALGVALAGIGVGLPQLVTPDGRVRSDHLFDWRELPAAQRLSAIAPARLESDVRAAARAEARFGAGRGHDIFCYLTIGTGLSYCLVTNGEPFAGARGYAIHFASMPQWTRCRACGAVHTATLEEIAAGPGIAAAYGARCNRPRHRRPRLSSLRLRRRSGCPRGGSRRRDGTGALSVRWSTCWTPRPW